jgi:hypothetical protein
MSSWTYTMPKGMILKSAPNASMISAPGYGHTDPGLMRLVCGAELAAPGRFGSRRLALTVT